MRKRPCFLLTIIVLLLGTFPAAPTHAQRVELIRDAEIEHTIRAYSTPLFQIAGLSPQAIKIFLVKDDALNAFVSGGANLFINTGTLMTADDPLEVIGVIAHETGHIAGGHIAGRGDAIRQAETQSIIATILGVGAAIATGQGGLASAVISGGQDVALKGLLTYTRTQESAADQAAIKYLTATQQSPRGLLEFMERISGQEVLLSDNQDPYLRTHPLTPDRIEFIAYQIQQSPYGNEPAAPSFVEMHDRMRAKLTGFLQPLSRVLKKYPESDRSIPARYARAIAYYRAPDLDKGLAIIEELIQERPDDPYFHELKGQMLFEHGQIAEAVPELEQAAALSQGASTINQLLAQAQIELNRPEMDQAALENINALLQREPGNSFAWRLAAIAHGRMGNEGLTALALAESAFARGEFVEARDRAKRAQKLFEAGSPAALRAQDLEIQADRRLKKS